MIRVWIGLWGDDGDRFGLCHSPDEGPGGIPPWYELELGLELKYSKVTNTEA